ncbi:decapping and exoribonuclease protein [Diachasma alloeum]|uniref:decapping and exoribonuclease protein n=1 Tax=Diachasma alloeum TaxID=454923 RepID=UPI000738467C|nr:decapping and exoribonuclease protein [Diachasma alloeum]
MLGKSPATLFTKPNRRQHEGLYHLSLVEDCFPVNEINMNTDNIKPEVKPPEKKISPKKNPQKNNKIFRVLNKYTDNFPTFQMPKVTGYWSIDGTRTQHHDSSQLRYYIPCNGDSVNIDLNEGLEQVVRRPDSLDHEKIDHLLRWIEKNYQRILAHPDSPRWLQPYFICFRGTLRKILKSPYNRLGWKICAAKWKGSIYLFHYETEYDKEKTIKEKKRNHESSYWGGKFRQYMLSDSPNKPPDVSKPVNECERFFCVFKGRLNDHSLLYRAEIDAVCSDRKFKDPLPLRHLKFMKIRTGKLSESPEQELARKKLRSLDLWSQMYLSGVNEVVYGLREDSDGIVRRMVKESVSELIEKSKEFWKPEICMKFCDEFLKFIHRTVRKNCDKTIYQFERTPFRDILVTELPPTSEYAFIPDWYQLLPKE